VFICESNVCITSLLQALGTGRVGAAAVAVDNCVYVLGGFIFSGALYKSVEILDLNDMHSWRKGVDMQECRMSSAAAFFNGSCLVAAMPEVVKL